MKSLEEFVALFAEQFDDTDASEITATTVFHDLDEWSSLIGLSVIAMVDEEFEVTLKGEDMRKANTPAELYEIIKSKMIDTSVLTTNFFAGKTEWILIHNQ